MKMLCVCFVACTSNSSQNEKNLVKNYESPYIIFNLPNNCKLKKLPEENVKIGNFYALSSPYMFYVGEDSLMFFETITLRMSCEAYFCNKLQDKHSPDLYGPYKNNISTNHIHFENLDIDNMYDYSEKVYTRFFSKKEFKYEFFGKKRSILDSFFKNKSIFFMTGVSIPSYYTSTISYLFFTADSKAEFHTELIESIFNNIELNDTTWSNCSEAVWTDIILDRRVQINLKNYGKISSKRQEEIYDSIYYQIFSKECGNDVIDSIKNKQMYFRPTFGGIKSPFKYEIKDRRLSPIPRIK